MENFPDYYYDINLFSVTLRLILAVILGGIIGLERGANKHPAGFRTHILVCVGAALSMMTNQYVYEYISTTTDPTRLGAQVITGVGFLGVGTILFTGRHKIKGLTTAAGLWTSACTGLAIGIGFYAGAVIAELFVFISLSILPKVENYFYNRSRIMDLYIELNSISRMREFISFVKSQDILVYETHLSKLEDVIASGGIGCHMSIKIPKCISHDEVIEILNQESGVLLIEEI
ncbi:MgtC/SapB family protein [Anaerovorax odorimutans]|uniref:MgtC/SapB family protein n=1 Tax=Anaerovorax odorimutans TaxID=109327 RepID=UPI00041B9EEB|nr:MgtC/SapB family protein [Anaerovorax odorimutans]